MTGSHSQPHRPRLWWQRFWPCWALLAFASLAAVNLLPGGYVRAVLSVPILLMVPGALTLGALFGPRYRLPDAVFGGFAALLGIAWSVFASLALYVLGVLITAQSTFWALLGVCTVLAVLAQARLLRAGSARRRAQEAFGGWYYALAAAVAGASLLAGGAYAWDHVHHPATAGYTWLAWTGPRAGAAMRTAQAGRTLAFEIVHRQRSTGTFHVRAVWRSTPSRPLAKPVTVHIGPEQTFHGVLRVPPIPEGCTDRVVIMVTGIGQHDPLTNQPPTWSINASVHGRDRRAYTGSTAHAPRRCSQ
jgi:hypothetical protein